MRAWIRSHHFDPLFFYLLIVFLFLSFSLESVSAPSCHDDDVDADDVFTSYDP